MRELGQGIGDMVVFLACIASFGALAGIGAIVGFVFSLFGLATAGLISVGAGLVVGAVSVALILRTA